MLPVSARDRSEQRVSCGTVRSTAVLLAVAPSILSVNRADHAIQVITRMTLLDTLHKKLDLAGLKKVLRSLGAPDDVLTRLEPAQRLLLAAVAP